MPSSRFDRIEALVTHLDRAMAAEHDLSARLRLVCDAVDGRIAFSTSLGMEDQAVLHAIAEAAPAHRIDVFMLDTGRHFPETLDLLAASERRFDRRITLIAPDREDVEALVARDGVLGFKLSVTARKACCHVRKVAPLRRALAGSAAWVTGLRRGQSAGRAEVPFAVWDEDHQVVKLNPAADWSLEALEAYIHDHAVPVNRLHAQGFPSIGCQPCTRAIRPGEDIRAGRWWWEQQDGKECGLHNSPLRTTAKIERREDISA